MLLSVSRSERTLSRPRAGRTLSRFSTIQFMVHVLQAGQAVPKAAAWPALCRWQRDDGARRGWPAGAVI